MKKKIRKLQLTTETLRNLDDRAAGQAAGGQEPYPRTRPSCMASCTCPNSSPERTCQPDTGPIITGPFYAGCPSYGIYCTADC